MQFAYKMVLGAEGRSTVILNYIFKYLEGLRTHAKISFVDFSSAFNILCPLILNYLKHLKHLSLIIILWVGLCFNTQALQIFEQMWVFQSLASVLSLIRAAFWLHFFFMISNDYNDYVWYLHVSGRR